ncbi:hypothetical protein GH714_037320 [Hevea brasiliensis]|uniref:Uncharacterized protein n=1 Tax=Hevea brasiliensis TaxID=3981 RepID=A0A6A6KLE0_HEVBR|nr:hypothetical protein GH714_037320 [Hevea brasiliensis]
MTSSMGLGFMAAFAVSGSVVLIARQVHKRLVSDFMKKIEFELMGSRRCQAKKRVRFAEDVIEPSSNNKQYRDRHLARTTEGRQMTNRSCSTKVMEAMPVNRQILYKGILEYRTHKGCNISA